MDATDARRSLSQLHNDLQKIVQRDQEQEVRGIALPVIDAVLNGVRGLVPEGHPVLMALRDLISAESVDYGEPIRAVDALLVVGQLQAAVPLAPTLRDRLDRY